MFLEGVPRGLRMALGRQKHALSVIVTKFGENPTATSSIVSKSLRQTQAVLHRVPFTGVQSRGGKGSCCCMKTGEKARRPRVC